MKRTKDFSNSQILDIINEYKNGESVLNLSRKHKVSGPIIYYWMYKRKETKQFLKDNPPILEAYKSLVIQNTQPLERHERLVLTLLQICCLIGIVSYLLNVGISLYKIYLLFH